MNYFMAFLFFCCVALLAAWLFAQYMIWLNGVEQKRKDDELKKWDEI
jgi:hypothetical protein